MSNPLQPHESQHARPPCPSPTPGAHSDSRPLSQWCHPAISSSVLPFSSCPQSLPASKSLRRETIKLLEENIGRTLSDINQSKILYDPPLGGTEIKTKVNKWDLIKLKSFCTAKEAISKVKRQPPKWEKIIANETTDKGLISKICKQLIQLNTRNTNNPIQKVAKRPKQIFLQRRHTYGKKYIKRSSKLLIIREIQIKIMRFHLTPVRMAIIKKFTNNKCWRGYGEKEACLHCWWECKLIQLL